VPVAHAQGDRDPQDVADAQDHADHGGLPDAFADEVT
jgi:hypothetical protein